MSIDPFNTFSIIQNKLDKSEKSFALFYDVKLTYIECINVQLESSEKASPVELLSVKLAAHLETISKAELYYLTGKATELLDKDLESLRSQNYIDYVIPFNVDVLQKNIEILKKELSEDFIVPEEISKLLDRSLLKQYRLTELGEKLLDSGIKDSITEGNLEFVFIQGYDKWNTIAHLKNSKRRNRYSEVDEGDFGYISAFLKSKKMDISKDKNFRNFNVDTVINIEDVRNSEIWTFLPNGRNFIVEGSNVDEISLCDKTPIDVDFKNISSILNSKGIEPNLISEEVPNNAPKGTYLSINLFTENDVKSVLGAVEESLSPQWCKDFLIDYEGYILIFKLLLIAKTSEAINNLAILNILSEYSDGAVKSRSKWIKTIEKDLQTIEKYSSSKGSVKHILDTISENKLCKIAEDFVKEDIMKFLSSENIENLIIQEEGNEIIAYCTLKGDSFVFQFNNRINEQEFDKLIIIAEDGSISQKYKLYLLTSDSNLFFAALLLRRYKNEIIWMTDFESYLSEINNSLPPRIQNEALPKVTDVVETINESYNENLLIAEELVKGHLISLQLTSHLVNCEITSKPKKVVEVLCKLEGSTINDLFEKKQINETINDLVRNLKLKLITEQEIEYTLVCLVTNTEDLHKLSTIHLCQINKGKITSLETLRKQYNAVQAKMTEVSNLTSSPKVNIKNMPVLIERMREYSEIILMEELIEEELRKHLAGCKESFDINFEYSGKLVCARLELYSEHLDILNEINSDLLDDSKVIRRQHKSEVFEFKTKIVSYDTVAAFKWASIMTANQLINNIKERAQIEKIFESYLSRVSKNSESSFDIPDFNIITELKSKLGDKLWIKEEIILNEILKIIPDYNYIKVEDNEISIFVSKKRFSDFINICPIELLKENKLMVPEIGKITVKFCSEDRNTFAKLLEIISRNTSFKDLKKTRKAISKEFDKLIACSTMKASDIDKLRKEKSQIVNKIIQIHQK